jgi:hypothetical protein
MGTTTPPTAAEGQRKEEESVNSALTPEIPPTNHLGIPRDPEEFLGVQGTMITDEEARGTTPT